MLKSGTNSMKDSKLPDCIIIRGADLSDLNKAFRPSSSWPDKHWTTQLVDAYSHRLGITIKQIDGEFVLAMTRGAKDEDEVAFKHIMEFCRSNNLDFTTCPEECRRCQGHPDCLANDIKET